MQDKASRPLIETLPMTLGTPYTDDPGTPQNIEIPLQVALPDGQVLYAAVALGGLPFHGQQQIAERIAAAWNAFAGVATSDISAPGQCLHPIQEPASSKAAPAAVAVPDGWKIVPVDPTEQMEQAAADYLGECVKAWGLWKAMIACAPEYPALAATPAVVKQSLTTDAALPEPDEQVKEVMVLVDELSFSSFDCGARSANLDRECTGIRRDALKTREAIESKLRALLATATGLPEQAVEKSATHGMNLGQRILHVGGRENAQTYIEFGSVAAVRALVDQVLRDLPDGAPGFVLPEPQAQADARDALTPAARDVLAERARQINGEGWTPERDDEYMGEELALAAAWYATPRFTRNTLEVNDMSLWPTAWEYSWFKPGNRRRELTKACALVLAEIERIDRATIAAAKGE